jgi:glycerol uptake facilitator protein
MPPNATESRRALGLPAWWWGELAGTFLLVFFGCGSVATAVLTGSTAGVFQVAIVWGLGIALAIHLTAALSGAHLNPAVSLALCVWQGFPKRRLPGYVIAQLLGAFLAAGLLFAIYGDALTAYESRHGIVRGAVGSEATAMVFGEFFPTPNGKPLDAEAKALMSHGRAFLAEFTGTAILLFVICGLTDARNPARPPQAAAAIGLTVTLLICLLGPLTMACFNPARDLGPRLFSSLAGWGSLPFTVNGAGWLTVYLLAPLTGGLIGVGLYSRLFQPLQR